jgi:hypothetical protein
MVSFVEDELTSKVIMNEQTRVKEKTISNFDDIRGAESLYRLVGKTFDGPGNTRFKKYPFE